MQNLIGMELQHFTLDSRSAIDESPIFTAPRTGTWSQRDVALDLPFTVYDLTPQKIITGQPVPVPTHLKKKPFRQLLSEICTFVTRGQNELLNVASV
jgi:hypothetical protein